MSLHFIRIFLFIYLFLIIKMGSNQSNITRNSQEIVTNMIQQSKQDCNISCTNEANNNNFIIKNSNVGDVGIVQSCKMSGNQCLMKQSFDTNMSSILDAMMQQSASAPSGLALSFNNISNKVSLNQLVENSVTQQQAAACSFTASNEANNNFFYVEDSTAQNLLITQTGEVNNQMCNMDIAATATVANQISSDVSQESQIKSLGTELMWVIIVAIVMGAFVMAVMYFSQSPALTAAATPSQNANQNSNIVDSAQNMNINDAVNLFNKFTGGSNPPPITGSGFGGDFAKYVATHPEMMLVL